MGGNGFGVFPRGRCSISVYVRTMRKGRDRFGKFDDKIYG